MTETNETAKTPLSLQVLSSQFSVCQCAEMPARLPQGGFYSLTRTGDEISIVCETALAPEKATAREDGWRALKVCGPLDFALVGILAHIASALAEASVPLFALSTYDTDYVLVKDDKLADALHALQHAGCSIEEG